MCIVCEVRNDSSKDKYVVAYAEWLVKQLDCEDIMKAVSTQEKIKLNWPSCTIGPPSLLRREITEETEWEEILVVILSCGVWPVVMEQVRSLRKYGVIGATKESRKNLKRKELDEDFTSEIKQAKKERNPAKDEEKENVKKMRLGKLRRQQEIMEGCIQETNLPKPSQSEKLLEELRRGIEADPSFLAKVAALMAKSHAKDEFPESMPSCSIQEPQHATVPKRCISKPKIRSLEAATIDLEAWKENCLVLENMTSGNAAPEETTHDPKTTVEGTENVPSCEEASKKVSHPPMMKVEKHGKKGKQYRTVRSISRQAWNAEQEDIQITPMVAVPVAATRNWSAFNAKRMNNDMMTYFFDRETMERSSVTGASCNLHKRRGIAALSKLDGDKVDAILGYVRGRFPGLENPKKVILEAVRAKLNNVQKAKKRVEKLKRGECAAEAPP